MKIIIKMQTRWNGEVLRPGDRVDIESEAARRWIDKRIAEPVSAIATEVALADDSSEFEDIPLEDLKYNELRKIASEKNIIVPRGVKKPELISLIRQPDGERADVKPAPTEEKKTDD